MKIRSPFYREKKEAVKVEKKKARVDFGSLPPILLTSSDQPQNFQSETIRQNLVRRGIITREFNQYINGQYAVPLASMPSTDAKYPEDFNDFGNYMDMYQFIPYIHRAVDIKFTMWWQSGFALDGKNSQINKFQDFLDIHDNLVKLRDNTLFALIIGDCYWRKIGDGADTTFQALNPRTVGLKLDSNDEVISYKVQTGNNAYIDVPGDEIIQFSVNRTPWSHFGHSMLQNVLPTVRNILFMEEKLPLIARKRAEPILLIQIGNKDYEISPGDYDRVKKEIETRGASEDIFHNGAVSIQEVYQSASVGGRQTIEPLLEHFMKNLIAGLGVPETALGFAGTSTMATADYQERMLHSEIKSFQRAMKIFIENEIFDLVSVDKINLTWYPLTEENLNAKADALCMQIQNGIISPTYARQALDYPDEAGDGVVMNSNLVPYSSDWSKPPLEPVQNLPSSGETARLSRLLEEPIERYEIRVLPTRRNR